MSASHSLASEMTETIKARVSERVRTMDAPMWAGERVCFTVEERDALIAVLEDTRRERDLWMARYDALPMDVFVEKKARIAAERALEDARQRIATLEQELQYDSDR